MPPVLLNDQEAPPQAGPLRRSDRLVALASRRARESPQPRHPVGERRVRREHPRRRARSWSNGLTVYSGSVAGEPSNATSSAARSRRSSASARSCGSVNDGGDPIGVELALRREQQMRERGCDRREHSEQEPRENQPPMRMSSSSVVERSTAKVCVSTSRERTCASSCARTASSSAGVSAAEETGAERERRAPRAASDDEAPRESRRRSAASFGGVIWSCAESRSTVERRIGSSASAIGRAPSIPRSARSPNA